MLVAMVTTRVFDTVPGLCYASVMHCDDEAAKQQKTWLLLVAVVTCHLILKSFFWGGDKWIKPLCSDEMKINCSFENGFCFWRHDADDDGDWMRKKGPSVPGLTGPSFDHTFANQSGKHQHLFSILHHPVPIMWISSSRLHCGRVLIHTIQSSFLGYYIITQMNPRNSEEIFRVRSLPLAPTTEPTCLKFWLVLFTVTEQAAERLMRIWNNLNLTLLVFCSLRYHMFGEDVWRLTVNTERDSILTLLFQKEGNYGNNWNYGQITVNNTTDQTVSLTNSRGNEAINVSMMSHWR